MEEQSEQGDGKSRRWWPVPVLGWSSDRLATAPRWQQALLWWGWLVLFFVISGVVQSWSWLGIAVGCVVAAGVVLAVALVMGWVERIDQRERDDLETDNT